MLWFELNFILAGEAAASPFPQATPLAAGIPVDYLVKSMTNP